MTLNTVFRTFTREVLFWSKCLALFVLLLFFGDLPCWLSKLKQRFSASH